MTRVRITAVLICSLTLAMATALKADVQTEQKTRFQLAGILGRMVNMFGGRAAREGVTSSVALKGDRRFTSSDTTGQIVDLNEEKVYDLDLRKKTYKVTTFAELRRQMEEQRRKAEEDSKKQQPREAKPEKEQDKDKNAKEMEVDFNVKNTGERKNINGFDTHQTIVTITVREKGKTLEQSGGLVMTTDMWLTSKIAAMKELQDFELRYAQKVYGPMVVGASPRDMATAMAMYPQMKPALEKMAAEGNKIDGTPVLTTMTMDAVKSAEEMANEAKDGGDSSKDTTPTTVGGLLGGLARRGAQKKSDEAPSNRATFLTTTNELLKLSTSVSADAVAIPGGFKENK